jgi:hypothetical protein
MIKTTNERKFLTYNGETQTLPEWGRRMGIDKATLYNRVVILGWDAKTALETPVTKVSFNKNQAEMMLNDMTFDQLPKPFQEVLANHATSKKYGQAVRKHHRALFDAWWEAEYSNT